MHTHVLKTYNHTGERPQGCQVREHAWRQLPKLVAAKVQIPMAKQKVDIDQMEPEKIVSVRDRDSSGDVFVHDCLHALFFTLPLKCTFVLA